MHTTLFRFFYLQKYNHLSLYFGFIKCSELSVIVCSFKNKPRLKIGQIVLIVLICNKHIELDLTSFTGKAFYPNFMQP